MKMTKEDYNRISGAIEAAIAGELDKVTLYKSLTTPTRFAWDLFYYAGLTISPKNEPGHINLYSYLNDTTITTGLLRVIGGLNIPGEYRQD